MTDNSQNSTLKLSLLHFQQLFKKYDLRLFGGKIEIDESIPPFNMELDTQQFPINFQKHLKALHINHLGALLNLHYRDLIVLPNFGNISFGAVYKIVDGLITEFQIEQGLKNFDVRSYAKTIPKSALVLNKEKSSFSIKSLLSENKFDSAEKMDKLASKLEEALAEISERNIVVLKAYLADGLTLQTIAEIHNITRERVRQIVAVNHKRFSKKALAFKNFLEADMLRIVLKKPALISDNYFANQKLEKSFFAGVIGLIFPYLPLEKNRRNMNYPSLYRQYSANFHEITSVLSQKRTMKYEDFVTQLHNLSPSNFIQSLTFTFSWSRIEITSKESQYFISMEPLFLHDRVKQILEESKKPLTFNQISTKLKKFGYSNASIRTHLQTTYNIYRIEPDSFGLYKHLPFSQDEINSIIEQSIKIIENFGHRVSSKEIFQLIQDQFPELKSKHCLFSILKNTDGFETRRGMHLNFNPNFSGNN